MLIFATDNKRYYTFEHLKRRRIGEKNIQETVALPTVKSTD